MDVENDLKCLAVDTTINDSVVSSTINYYGHGLLKQLVDTKPHLLPLTAMKDINYHSFKARSSKLNDHQEVRLYTTAVDFILKNAVHLFSQPSCSSKTEADVSKYGYMDKYKSMPPIEYYFQANKKTRLQQFYKDLRRGDILICRANQAGRSLSVQSLKVVARDAGPHQLLVKGLAVNVNLDLSKTRVPKIDESSIPNTWLANTLLKVEVLSVMNVTSTEIADIMVGTLGETLKSNDGLEIVLGKIGRTDVPDIINAVESYTRDSVGSFSACLQKLESFKNPRSVQHLASQMGLSMKNCSLMPTLRSEFPPSLQYRQLRRLQLSRWAHKHVADGVAHFKRGQHTEAFQLLNKALNIDSENVEAYVAKGALLANMGSFEKAVEDFESALKFNPSHGNARKYICETLHELGKRHEEDGKLGLAESCYLRSLQVNPEHKGCLFAVTKLHGRTGFASTITKKIMAGIKEENDEEAHVLSSTMDDEKKTKVEEEVEIVQISDEDVKPLRPKSLSPFAQKMALQNNAWNPPSYIQTTDTFLNQKEAVELKTLKKNETISPFVIGRNKDSISDSQNPTCDSNLSVSNTVQSLPGISTSTIPSSVCAVISCLVESITSTMSTSGESCRVSSGQPVVYPSCSSTPVVVSANSSATFLSDSSGQLKDVKSELDRNFENMLLLKPETHQDVEALSMLLLVLSKRYKAQDNYERAMICLKKSLQHNPTHAPTLKALEELLKISKPPVVEADSVDESAMPITAHYQMGTRIKQQPPSVYSGFSEHPPSAFMQEYRPTVNEQQLLQYPAYARPAEPADYIYSNMYSSPSADVVNAPLQMQFPSVPGGTPKRGHWGTDYLPPDHSQEIEPETDDHSKSFQSQEDKDYFDRVNSFLNKIMLRGPSTSSGKAPSSSKTRRYSPHRSRSRSISRDRRSGSRSKFRVRRSRSRSKIRSKRSRSWSKSRASRSKSRDSSLRPRIDHSWSRDSLPKPILAKSSSLKPRDEEDAKRSLSRDAGSKSTSCSNSPHSKGKLHKAKHSDKLQKVSNKQHSRKRSKDVKKRRRSRSSSYSSSSSRSSRSRSNSSTYSSSSSSSYSSSRSRSSGRSSRRSKNKKKRRHSKRDRKGKLKIGIEDDPLLQGLDKDILKKLTEKLQANALLLDSKESKKKKKKKKDEKDSDLHKKKNRVKNEKKETDKMLTEEVTVAKKKLGLDMEENNENKKAVDVETNPKKEKKIKKGVCKNLVILPGKEENIEKVTLGSNKNNDKSIKETKDKNAKAPPAIKDLIIKSKQKAALSKGNLGIEGKSVEKEFKELDIEKAAQNDTLLDIKALMQLPGLEDLKLKLRNYYTMCGEKQPDLGAKKCLEKQSSESVLPDKPVKEPALTDKSSCAVTVPKKKETLKTNVSVIPDVPVPPELPKSGFKSTFTPVMSSKVPESVRPSFDSLFRMESDILTPKEFRSGLKELKDRQLELKDRQFQEVLSKAQIVANNIDRSVGLEEGKDSKKRRHFSRSRSKSKSHNRRSRSRSRSPIFRSFYRRSRSKSSDRRLRTRNRSRSRSGSPQYKNRSRYTFVRDGYNPGRSSYRETRGNRSFGWSSQGPRLRRDDDRRRQRTRSRSKSRSKVRSSSKSKSRSNSPRRSESRTRSYSPRRPPPKPSTSSKPVVCKEKVDKEKLKKSPKTAMFGKWAKSGQKDDNEGVADPGKALDEMESFLIEAKKKKMEEMKDRNKVFLKNPVN